MADWRGVQAGLQSGYEMGRSAGGRLSALGQSIAKLADSFRQQREAGEQAQAGILGEVAKARIGREEIVTPTNIPEDFEIERYTPAGVHLRRKTIEPEITSKKDQNIKKQYNPEAVSTWADVPVGRRLLSAITPSATLEEKKLGGLRPGGVLKPPQKTQSIQSQLPKTGLRERAIQELRSAGYPETDKNINAAVEQLKK